MGPDPGCVSVVPDDRYQDARVVLEDRASYARRVLLAGASAPASTKSLSDPTLRLQPEPPGR